MNIEDFIFTIRFAEFCFCILLLFFYIDFSVKLFGHLLKFKIWYSIKKYWLCYTWVLAFHDYSETHEKSYFWRKEAHLAHFLQCSRTWSWHLLNSWEDHPGCVTSWSISICRSTYGSKWSQVDTVTFHWTPSLKTTALSPVQQPIGKMQNTSFQAMNLPADREDRVSS